MYAWHAYNYVCCIGGQAWCNGTYAWCSYAYLWCNGTKAGCPWMLWYTAWLKWANKGTQRIYFYMVVYRFQCMMSTWLWPSWLIGRCPCCKSQRVHNVSCTMRWSNLWSFVHSLTLNYMACVLFVSLHIGSIMPSCVGILLPMHQEDSTNQVIRPLLWILWKWPSLHQSS